MKHARFNTNRSAEFNSDKRRNSYTNPHANTSGEAQGGNGLNSQGGIISQPLPQLPVVTDDLPLLPELLRQPLHIITLDNTTFTLFTDDEPFTNFDPSTNATWNLRFAVSNGKLSALSSSNPVGETGTTLYDGNYLNTPIIPQTFYRLPVARTVDSSVVTFPIGGVYRENRAFDIDKGVIVELVKIG